MMSAPATSISNEAAELLQARVRILELEKEVREQTLADAPVAAVEYGFCGRWFRSIRTAVHSNL
ncbi:MAG: hypothetical protein BJ554DRAFT_6022 [Olpidium bornovanus]|uniref:Uncharacterized protein n=1 Tax=Olpidium bornovanus TaxID=278681 RepID=A0A8H8DKJ8_9FUNG|nr:MAG: hypothetical protein BJ554DRAFT_6022 [Olpidium bornovanus]